MSAEELNNRTDEYWAIDIPGLTGEQAQALEERLASEFEFGVSVVSPHLWMTRHYDRASVESIARCLRAGLAADGMARSGAADVESLLEDCEEWLKQAIT